MTVLETALSKVQDYYDFGREYDRVNKLLTAAPKQLVELDEANERFNGLLNGEGSYDELLEAARDVVRWNREAEAHNRVRSALNAKRVTVGEDRKTARDTSAAVDWLAAELAALVAEVREIDAGLGEQLATPLNLERAGLSPVAADLLADRYREIRAAQYEVFFRVGRHLEARQAFKFSGYLRDAFDTEACWAAERHPGRRRMSGSYSLIGESEYWKTVIPGPVLPFNRHANEVFPETGSPFEYVRWICVNADPWVPRFEELVERHELAESLLRTPSSLENLDSMRVGLARYRGEEEPSRAAEAIRAKRITVVGAPRAKR